MEAEPKKVLVRLLLWGTIILLVAVGMLWLVAPKYVPLVILVFVVGVVAIVLVFGHDNWGWKGWMAIIIPTVLLFFGWGIYELAMKVSRPPVYLDGIQSCEIYKQAIGVSSCEQQDIQAQLCNAVPDEYGGIDCKSLFEALQADTREGNQSLPTFQTRWAEYSVAKSREISERFEVSGADMGLNLGLVILIFVVSTGVSMLLPKVSKGPIPSTIVILLSIVLMFGGGLFWQETKLIPYGEAAEASWKLFVAGVLFQSLVGSGLALSAWTLLSGKIKTDGSKKWHLVVSIAMGSIGAFLSAPTLFPLLLMGGMSNAVVNTQLTMSQAILSVCLGQTTGVGVQTLVTKIISWLRG